MALVVVLLVALMGTDCLADWVGTIGSDYAEVVQLVVHVDSTRLVLMFEAVVEELDPSYELNLKDIRR